MSRPFLGAALADGIKAKGAALAVSVSSAQQVLPDVNVWIGPVECAPSFKNVLDVSVRSSALLDASVERRCNMPVRDDQFQALLPLFPKAIEFISKCTGRVLICCNDGVSSSPAFAAAFLIHEKTLSAKEALAAVSKARSVACVNANFREQLEELADGEKAAPVPHNITVEPTSPPRFDIFSEQEACVSFLKTHGWCVVRSACDPDEVEQSISLMWDFLESTVPNSTVRRDDPRTWGEITGGGVSLVNPSNGIINTFGIGQSDLQWKLRTQPAVLRAFAAVWGVAEEDLLTSFDGANVFLPVAHGFPATAGGWWHTDQNSRKDNKSGMCCVQGLVTLTDANETTGGLCVLSGSHLDHEALCDRHASSLPSSMLRDFVPLKKEDEALDGRFPAQQICARAGDLVLWDSRTVHCNTPALSKTAAACPRSTDGGTPVTAQLQRVAGYVCMTPRTSCKNEPLDTLLDKRLNAFCGNETTTHWPNELHSCGVPPPGWLATKALDGLPFIQRRIIGTND